MVAAAPASGPAASPPARSSASCVLVVVAVATAIALFEIPTRVIGLLGLVPLALGLRGLVALRHPEAAPAPGPAGRRAAASRRPPWSPSAPGATTWPSTSPVPGGRRHRAHRHGARSSWPGEALLTLFMLRGRTPPARGAAADAVGVVAAPLLYCAIGCSSWSRPARSRSIRLARLGPTAAGSGCELLHHDPARALRLVVRLQDALRRRRHVVVQLHHLVVGRAVHLGRDRRSRRARGRPGSS